MAMPSAAVAGVDELLRISAHRRHSVSIIYECMRRTLNEHGEGWPAGRLHCSFAHLHPLRCLLSDILFHLLLLRRPLPILNFKPV